MPIAPNDMLAISLPAAYWNFLMWAARKAPAPHEDSHPVIEALAGQLQGIQERRDAEDQAAAELVAEANPEPEHKPTPPRARKRAR